MLLFVLITTVGVALVGKVVIEAVEDVEQKNAERVNTVGVNSQYRYDLTDDRLTLSKEGVIYVSSEVFQNTKSGNPDSVFGEREIVVVQGGQETLLDSSGSMCIATCSITMREMPEGDFDVVFYLNDGSKHKVSYQSSTAGGRVLTKEELFSYVIKPEVVSLGADRVYVKLDDENGVSSMSFMSEGLERVPFGERKYDREFVVDKDSLSSSVELTFSTSYVVGGEEVDFTVVVDREAILSAL